jgi:hypothetical protein
MLILNRGPQGAGYLWCPICEHARPAPTDAIGGAEIRAIHNNPRTGDRCRVETLKWPVDLAHIFETDLRGIRISQPMPTFSDLTETERRAALDGFVRTLAESLRLAAADLLDTDPRDLRATTEMPGGSPMVILSDAVPGGAGYCRRLFDEPRFSARALIGRAVAVLDCPRGDACESSCSRCLNDYSNQAQWDRFDRHPVLAWLRSLLASYSPRPGHAPESSVPVAQTAAATLGVRLEGASLVAVAAQTLWGATDRSEALTSAIALRNWLDEGPERHAVFFIPETAIASGSATGLDRQLALRLFEYERNGRIRFASLPADRLKSAPRLSMLVNGQVRAFYGSVDPLPALAGALAGISHQSSGPATDSWLSNVQGEARPLPGPLAALTEQLRAFRFRPGSPRKLTPMFQPVAGRQVDLHIEDPWCGARSQNRTRLAEFLRAVANSGVQIKGLTIVWNPDNQEGETGPAHKHLP